MAVANNGSLKLLLQEREELVDRWLFEKENRLALLIKIMNLEEEISAARRALAPELRE